MNEKNMPLSNEEINDTLEFVELLEKLPQAQKLILLGQVMAFTLMATGADKLPDGKQQGKMPAVAHAI